MIEVRDLHVSVEGQEILKGVSLTFEKGKVHAVMGPNGSGKSTLAKAIMGHPSYVVTSGQILLNGEDITTLPVEERARKGLFLSFQNPVEVTGVKIGPFIRAAVNVQREDPYSVMEFHKVLKEKMNELRIDPSFSTRYVNVGLSGGEKKQAEILQMAMLQPQYAILDETDSGLDVDSIKTVAEKINSLQEAGIMVITHYNRFLQHITPDVVTVLHNGEVVMQGGAELAGKIEEEGFDGLKTATH